MLLDTSKERLDLSMKDMLEQLNRAVEAGYKAGVAKERGLIADFIRNHAENWQRTPTFNYRIELHKLAEVIERGNNVEPRT